MPSIKTQDKSKLSTSGKTVASLDQRIIRHYLSSSTNKQLKQLLIFKIIPSTNTYLLENASQLPKPSICLAEQQTAGKGRFGKSWYSPAHANIYLSILWQIPKIKMSLPLEISLATGVVIINTIKKWYPINNKIGIKWPNDLFYSRRKLAGILVELLTTASGDVNIVLGLGLNINMTTYDDDLVDKINQPYTDLQTITGVTINRNILIGRLIDSLFVMFKKYKENELKQYLRNWQSFDILKDKMIKVISPTQSLIGVGYGINDKGELIVIDQCKTEHVFSNSHISIHFHD